MLPLLKQSMRGHSSLFLLSKRKLSIHQYQAQQILADHGIPVPDGRLARNALDVRKAIERFGGHGVLKAQILASDRDRGTFQNGFESGIHVVASPRAAEMAASKMLGQRLITKQTGLDGLPVDKMYVVQKLDATQQYYLAINIDRSLCCPVIVMSKVRGVGNEDLTAEDFTATARIPLKYSEGVTEEVVSAVVRDLEITQAAKANISDVLGGLYAVFKTCDAIRVEINPLIIESGTSLFISANSKVTIDDAAAKRQERLFSLRDTTQEHHTELEAEKNGLLYVQLQGKIGCLANGAGLAMATNDAVAHYGGKCANFLDGGGQATKETMIKAFDLILSDKQVSTILVNIYGGIIRCDMISEAIIGAAERFKDIPVVVRLQGTNSDEGQRLIAQSGLKLFAEAEFGGAVKKAIELAVRSTKGLEDRVKDREATEVPNFSQRPCLSRTSAKLHGQQPKRKFRTAARLKVGLIPHLKTSQPSSTTRRTFTTSSHRPAYGDTIANLAIDSSTTVIYQGFTGRAATANALATLSYGTRIVGGVSPNRFNGQDTHLDLPLFSSCRAAAAALNPTATAVFVPAQSAASAILEAIEAEIPLIVSVAEHVPVHDMLRVQEALRSQSKSRLVGPNCPGIINPVTHTRIGIMPYLQYSPGCVGIASKSGTLSYEAVGATTRVGLGQSLCIGVGGDILPGTSLTDALQLLVRDENTKGIVLLGEIGGDSEIEAAEFIRDWRAQGGNKPIVGMVTGRTAPKGRIMGHAGAVEGYDGASAEDKVKALEGAGVLVPVHPGEIGTMMRELMENQGWRG